MQRVWTRVLSGELLFICREAPTFGSQIGREYAGQTALPVVIGHR